MIRHCTSLALLFAITCLAATGLSQEKSVRPGINDTFEKPDVASFVERFEREGREVYDFRNEIVDACDLRPGMTIADVGAGTGLFTRILAQRVGETGKVLAVDISKDFVDHVTKICHQNGLKNVEGVVCTADSTNLKPQSIDVAFVCDVYHHFEYPYRSMRSIRQALKPGGTVVVIDFHRTPGTSSDWILDHVRADQKTVLREIELSGFTLRDEKKFLKETYWMRFTAMDRKTETGHTTDTLADVQRQLKDGTARLLDVREPREWEQGHLADATLLPLSAIQAGTKSDTLPQELDAELPKNQIIYLHCRSGGRVLVASQLLRKFGYDIRPLKAGFSLLADEGFERANDE
jgi:ubiquinone/menaquinone biosynthesis C-methylase UbiE/rhodanese-related sulfurtransferase